MPNTDLVPLNLDQKGPWTIYHGATDWLQWKWIRLIVFHFRQIQCWAKINHLNIMYWESGCPFCIRDLLLSYKQSAWYHYKLLWISSTLMETHCDKSSFPGHFVPQSGLWKPGVLHAWWASGHKQWNLSHLKILVYPLCSSSSATSSEFTGVIPLEHPGVKCFAQGSSRDSSWLASCGKLATS